MTFNRIKRKTFPGGEIVREPLQARAFDTGHPRRWHGKKLTVQPLIHEFLDPALKNILKRAP